MLYSTMNTKLHVFFTIMRIELQVCFLISVLMSSTEIIYLKDRATRFSTLSRSQMNRLKWFCSIFVFANIFTRNLCPQWMLGHQLRVLLLKNKKLMIKVTEIWILFKNCLPVYSLLITPTQCLCSLWQCRHLLT